MKVVLFVDSFLPQIGGKEIVVHYLARSLKEAGHQVRVVGPAGWWKYRALRFGYPVHRPVGSLRRFGREYVLAAQLFLDLALWGGDVVHAHCTHPNGYAATLLKRVRRIPVVITAHGVDIHVIPELQHGLRLRPGVAPKITYALQHAEFLTAISASIEHSYLDAGAPAQRIRPIPNGVDVERFQGPPRSDVRSALGLAPDSRIVLSVGNYHPRKGQEVLVRAMPLVIAAEPRARLVIAGRGTEALQPVIEECGMAGHVSCPGSIAPPSPVPDPASESTDRLADLYKSAELYVSAGVEEGAEGLSLAVLDAMAAGLPVVATNISGNRDIVHEGKNGILVPPASHSALGEAVTRVLGSAELHHALASEAHTLVEPYHWREIAKQYVALYEEARALCRSSA